MKFCGGIQKTEIVYSTVGTELREATVNEATFDLSLNKSITYKHIDKSIPQQKKP